LKSIPASKVEIETLGADTRFSKADCFAEVADEFTRAGDQVYDHVSLSIVMSGYDLNNSIHRPERCMPAQGHTILDSTDLQIALNGGKEFDVKRLKTVRSVSQEDSKTTLVQNYITYYFFIGHDQVTNDHLARTFIDIKDRLVRGMDQRWAYVSASICYGDVAWPFPRKVSEEDADAKLKSFITELAGQQILWGQIAE
jgi:hypothetical protein